MTKKTKKLNYTLPEADVAKEFTISYPGDFTVQYGSKSLKLKAGESVTVCYDKGTLNKSTKNTH